MVKNPPPPTIFIKKSRYYLQAPKERYTMQHTLQDYFLPVWAKC